MDTSNKVGTILGTVIGATNHEWLGNLFGSVYVQAIILAFLGGVFGYLGTEAVKWVHKKLKK